ncbi:DNA mismatch repair protein MutS, partial [human gut metagenome]
DCLCSLAVVAVKNNYCCPAVDESGVIEIHQGRHPVVEAMRPDALFVPNDTYMGRTQDRVSIITGPNMAGKSTYMRQVALMVLMAQIGSFVPAKAARLGIVDRVFTRIGASDDLSAGQSTFMVEMTEVSDILHAATDKSLLILDEIGRGTSTFDGMSIARACWNTAPTPSAWGQRPCLPPITTSLPPWRAPPRREELQQYDRPGPGEEIVFLRKIVPGGADRSYGIEVAKLAGLPDAVVSRARKILRQLEEESGRPAAAPAPREDQVSFAAVA